MKKILITTSILLLAAACNQQAQVQPVQPSPQPQAQTKPADETSNLKTSSTLTPDEIFQEVATQFNLNRNQISYFRIFGQDKVQYSKGSGTNFAYKQNGKWYLAGDANSQEVQPCENYKNVPESYRPFCSDTTNGHQNKYTTTDGHSTNYPDSLMTSYIGQ